MYRVIANPFFVYPLSFILVFLLYNLGWSDLYPSLKLVTILFFIVSFVIYSVLGYFFQKNKYIGYKYIPKEVSYIKHLKIIYIGFLIEFLYAGDIPLFSVIMGYDGVGYRDFGIKSLHVFLVSYNSFITVLLFHKYISEKTRKNLFVYLLSLLPALLIMGRGMIIIGLFSSFFVFIQSLTKGLSIKKILSISLIAIVVMYFFGLLGNLRSGFGDPLYIPKNSKATNEFINSNIPKEFYWTYLYGASPLANLQYNINNQDDVKYNFFDFALFEIVPKVIHKRVALITGSEPVKPKLMVDWLTVGTIYSKSFGYVKWFGPIIMMLYVAFLLVFVIGMVPKSSNYHVATTSVLSTLIFMNTFSNMVVFSGVILQLAFPILFFYLENKKIVIKSSFNNGNKALN